MEQHPLVRRIHRIGAIVFLLSIPLAAVFAFTGDPEAPSPVVYLPFVPLLALTLTGTYILVRPWLTRRSGPA